MLVAMNGNERRTHHPAAPMDYVARRLSSLPVVGGVISGFLTASLLESAGLPGPVAAGAGVLVFVVATSLATGLAARRQTLQRGRGPQ